MKIRKRLCSALLAAALLMTSMSACSMKLSVDDTDTSSDLSAAESQNGAESTSTRNSSVSIIQYIDYSSLNECCEGIRKVLDSEGIPYDVTVGKDNSAREDCEQKARDLMINSSCDLVIAIGTPCAETVCPIISSGGRTPVVFCAVTDPVGAGIIESASSPGVSCTGVATAFNINEQLNMINTFQPSITRLGVIYTASEKNAEAQLMGLKKAAEKLGITVFDIPVENPSQLSDAAKELNTKAEAVVILPDNMVSKNSWNITSQTIAGEIPLYGVNISQVREGALAGYCYDFVSLGESAGQQAVSILHGESAADMPVVMAHDCNLYVNSDRLKDLDMKIPDEYKAKATEVKTSYDK